MSRTAAPIDRTARRGPRSAPLLPVLLACLPLGSPPARAETVATPPSMPAASRSPTLLRTALIVADADRAVAFYRLLGFRVESDTGSQARRVAGNPFPLNAPATRSRLVILGSASGDGGRIGLVEFAAPTPPDRRAGVELVGRGDPVLVFDVADADAVHAALLAGGARIHEPPQVYVSARQRADGTPMRGKVFHAWDPDGYLIELLEAPR